MLALVIFPLIFNACLMFRWRNEAALFLRSAMSARIALRAIFTAGFGMVAISVFSPPASAAEWSMTPTLRLGYEQNDNYTMTLQPHNSVHGSVIAPRLDMGVQSEIWGIMGTAQATRKRYSGEEGLDRDDEAFSLFSQYKTERNSFTINASRVNDAVISGEPGDPDVGLATIQKSRRTENVQPTWTWFMTERAQVQLGYQLSEVSYIDGKSVGLYDYQWRAATATLSYSISPQSQFFITADYSKYRAPDTNIQSLAFDGNLAVISTFSDVDSRTQNFKAGVGHVFSETMQGTLMLGQRKTETDRAVTECLYLFGSIFVGCFPGSQATDDTGTTFSGDLKKKFEKLDVTATASRDISASGAGTEVESDLLSVEIKRPITARLRGTLTATGRKTRNVTDTTNENRRYYSVQPNLHWNWTREADVSLAYRYSNLKREAEDQSVESNAVFLTLAYVWPKFSVSR